MAKILNLKSNLDNTIDLLSHRHLLSEGGGLSGELGRSALEMSQDRPEAGVLLAY